MKTASLYQDLEYNPSKPLIKVLLDTSFTKEIRIAMQKGTLMKEHKTAFPIVVQIIEGVINFGVQGKVFEMKKGDLVALEGNINHDLQANENSIIRLTLTKHDRTERVENVVSDKN
jgi:quercetin dioxygenase-like cupin family protein